MGEWFEESFGEDYLLVYKHRDYKGAYDEVRRMTEWLDLPAGARVLDLCCGMGRHSLALADFGYQVTGIDLSERLLQEAVKSDPAERVAWFRGDMRQVPLDRPFDAVLNLFTSFGYFESEEENVRVLSEISRLLRPGGQYLIDFLNPAYVAAHLVPHSERSDGDTRIEENRRIRDGFVCKSIHIHQPGRPVRQYEERVRLYGLDDFRRMLDRAELEITRVYGGYDSREYESGSSPRLIIQGRKKEIL